MCGIVGYCGAQPAAPAIIEGLRRLEYRGYDSAGVAFLGESGLEITRRVGKLAKLTSALDGRQIAAPTGIGHTRWATHGRPSVANAHPHTDQSGQVAVVHNGIIDNFRLLREQLAAEGAKFSSETDSEVIVQLIARQLPESGDLATAVRAVVSQLSGSFAFVALWTGAPGEMVAARQASPLVIGVGDGENLVASDIPAVIPHTRRIMHLHNGDVARISSDEIAIWDPAGPVERGISVAPWSPALAERGAYRHFMQKEIFEQPRALADTLQGRIRPGSPQVDLADLAGLELDPRNINRVLLLGCGTSLHAAMIGQYYFEQIAGIRAEIENAAEYHHRLSEPETGTLVVAISQSGETFDTVQAAIAAGPAAALLALTNVPGSSLARGAKAAMIARAGPEIGVASTKTFTTSLALLYLLAVGLGYRRGSLSEARAIELLEEIARLPQLLDQVLAIDRQAESLSHELSGLANAFFIGRGALRAIAYEGALKLKELTYIHAEGYPAGELKHGPIALITEAVPTVVIAPANAMRAKMISSMEEIKSRDGKVLVLGTEGDAELAKRADWMLALPPVPSLLNPIAYVVPLHLLAYHIALRRGCDVDQPRNLAKTVTVE